MVSHRDPRRRRCGPKLKLHPGNSQGTFYSLSLAQSFDVRTTNLSSLFTKGPNPATTQANFEDGAMFGNDEEIILYGCAAMTYERAWMFL